MKTTKELAEEHADWYAETMQEIFYSLRIKNINQEKKGGVE